MSVDGGVASEQALGADDARFNRFAGLHDRQQRDHAAQRKIDQIDLDALLDEQGVRRKLDPRKPRQYALELVIRKLPQDAVLYDVLGWHMLASVAPSAGQRPRHGPGGAPNSACGGDSASSYTHALGSTNAALCRVPGRPQ